MSKRWDGQTSATQLFQERAAAVMAACARAPPPRSLVAEAKRYPEDTAAPLATRGLITRIPGPLTLVAQVITPARPRDRWPHRDETTRDDGLECCHDGLAQRGLVVASQAAMARAEASITNAPQRAGEAIGTQLLHGHAHRFPTPAAAHAALTALSTSWRDQQLATSQGIDHKREAGPGRPTPTRPLTAMAWQMHAQVRPAQDVMEAHTPQRACVVMGTPIHARQGSDAEVIRADNAPSGVEGGFRLRNDPWFFVSSLVGKNPRRMHGVWLVMTVAWLVYALTPRRGRQHLAERHATIPPQLHQPTERPPLRGVFQLFDGLHRVHVLGQGQVPDLLEGLNAVQSKLLRLVGEEVCRRDQLSPG